MEEDNFLKKGNYEKIIFSFTDSRPTLSYETLKYFFKHFETHKKSLNIAILTTFSDMIYYKNINRKYE